ncbi:hypothetical protein [Trebonia sp.]|uniref:hypothetical protein n=1 Tax=Trebonia sp. TaxID=2767075 RepID=UPI00262A675D|nr:hypothetical protein [Trebonia sp.]
MVLAMRNRAHTTAITLITRNSAMSWLKVDWPGHAPVARVTGSPAKGDAPVWAVR